jgi:hypothetical protein
MGGLWCQIIVMDVHEDPSRGTKGGFYEELEGASIGSLLQVQHENSFARDSNAKVMREDILK